MDCKRPPGSQRVVVVECWFADRETWNVRPAVAAGLHCARLSPELQFMPDLSLRRGWYPPEPQVRPVEDEFTSILVGPLFKG